MGRNGMGRNGHGPKWLWAEMTSDHLQDMSMPRYHKTRGKVGSDLLTHVSAF